MSLGDKLIAIADKIRNISGISQTMNLDAMSTNLNNIQSNISQAFSVIEEKGGVVPASKNIPNLTEAIQSIPEGVSLNFKIEGGTSEPEPPSENMIWVNTDIPITSYVFDVSQPSSPIPGMVWIKIGTSSDVKFNTLKENTIMIYPKTVKQYIDTTWVDKDTETYLNGKWYNWITGYWDGALYIDGVDYSDITGGWTAVGLGGSAEGYTYYSSAPTLTKNETNMTATISGGTNSSGFYSGVVRTANAIPLKKYSVLKFTGKGNASGGYVRLLVLSTDCDKFQNATKTVVIPATSSSSTYTIDVSDLTESYYIAVMTAADTGKSPVTCTINSILLT